VSDYGKSKLLAEEEAIRYKDRMPVVILRPSAVYGPRDADMFELFRWAAKGLWVELSGGDRFINPCFVKDLASALLLAAEKQTASGSIYFVAEDRPYSWSEFREALLSSGGVKARTIKIPYWAAYLMGLVSEFGALFTSKPALTNRQKVREAVQRYWTCDLTKSENELGFRAAFPLEKGLRITWEWYRKQGWIT
jgi:nucleoside-diphosphate-sugar epimerase